MSTSEYKHHTDIEVRFRDTDALGHVNNAVYLTYREVGREAYWARVAPDVAYDRVPFVLANCDIAFRSPSYTGETLRVFQRTIWVGERSFAIKSEIRERDSERIVATATSVLVTYDYAKRAAMAVPDWLRRGLESVEGGPLPDRPR
jgi:acyl-CoA thioester hydrolase